MMKMVAGKSVDTGRWGVSGLECNLSDMFFVVGRAFVFAVLSIQAYTAVQPLLPKPYPTTGLHNSDLAHIRLPDRLGIYW